ncbi:MAG: hypothetical protein GY821_05275 [Gammaproteobacteria bacterium]|nr:hypothetical protein [Gammaproteobacteria bacterium]
MLMNKHCQQYLSLQTKIEEDYIIDDSIDNLVESDYTDRFDMEWHLKERLQEKMDKEARKFLYYSNLFIKSRNIQSPGKNYTEMGQKVNSSIWDKIKYIFSCLASFLVGGDVQQVSPQVEIKKQYRKQSDSTTAIQSEFMSNEKRENQIETKVLVKEQNKINDVSQDNKLLKENKVDNGVTLTPIEFFYYNDYYSQNPMNKGLTPPTEKMSWDDKTEQNNKHQYTPDIAFSSPNGTLTTIYERQSNPNDFSLNTN